MVAIILGSLLGLAIAFGAWRANDLLTSKKLAAITTSNSITPAPTASATNDLVVTQPEDESLTQTDTISVEGKTTPGATVIITTPVYETITLADAGGKFSMSVKLESGANTILVTSIDDNNNSLEKEITVTYSSEFKTQ